MPENAYTLRAQAIENLMRFKRPDVPPQVVARNTLAVVLPLAAGLAGGHLAAGLAVSAGALNTMFSDQPGPYRQRFRRLLWATLAAGTAALVGFLVGGLVAPMLLATAAFGFAGGLLVVFGADAARVGMTSIILLVIAAATPLPPREALAGAALIVCGGLLLTLFSLAAWPLLRYWPERQALATVYAGLADLAAHPGQPQQDAPALSDAMGALQHTLLGRYRARGRAMEAFTVLLELAERIRLELTALDDAGGPPQHARELRADAAAVLDAIADALRQGTAPDAAQQALDALRAHERAHSEPHPAGAATRLHAPALAGQLGAAVRNANWAGSRGELRASSADVALPQALRGNAAWPTLRANLTPRSIAFRHATRTAACLCLATLAAHGLRLPHGYWLPMTVAIVLRADFAATFKFGLARVSGTVLGLASTTALLAVTPETPWAHLALLAVLCLAFRYLAGVHYATAVAALTGTVVILLAFEGVDPGSAMFGRALSTALACVIALAAYAAWPTWERTRARAAQAALLDAYAAYLRTLAGPGSEPLRRETRTAARTARSNAQASFERARSEPATPPRLLALLQALLANGNRLARSAMALEALRADAAAPPPAAADRFVASLAQAVERIAAALRTGQDPPALPRLRAQQRALVADMQAMTDAAAADVWQRITDRLVDNVDTLAHVVRQDPRDAVAMA